MGAVIELYSCNEVARAKRETNRIVPKGGDSFAIAKEIRERQTAVKSFDNTQEVNQMVTYFLERGRFRDACLFILGCNTSMRIGDILDFRWRDLVNDEETTYVTGAKIERKTQKFKTLYFNEAIHEATMLYKANLKRPYNPNEYMFISEGPRSGHIPPDWRNDPADKRVIALEVQPMHARSVSRIIRNAAKDLGLYTDGRHVSTHSMRKTAMSATSGFVEGVNIPQHISEMHAGLEMAKLMGNHSDIRTTAKHYVDMEEHLVNEAYKSMNLGLEAILDYKNKER